MTHRPTEPSHPRRRPAGRSAVALLTLALALPALSACTATPAPEEIRGQLERELPGTHFEPEEHIRLGRFSLALVRGILNMVDDEDSDVDQARKIMAGLRRVDVATYRVTALPELDDRVLSPLLDRLHRGGWQTVVRARESGSHAWILTRGEAGEVFAHLFVVSLERDELVIVRLDGHLDRVLAEAIADHPQQATRALTGGEG